MTAVFSTMANDIRAWMSDHSLGIGGYSFVSGLLGQIHLTERMGDFMGTLAHINVVIATCVGVLTLVIKAIDLIKKVSKKKKEDDETDRDS